MPKLIGNGNKLGARANELLRNRGSECCCNEEEKAYQYAECCDGFPRIWVAARAFLPASLEPCPLIRVGRDSRGKPVCFHLSGAEATLRELDNAGITYITQFNTAVGDGCGPASCGDGIALEVCRECPVECCIRGYPPNCKDEPRSCCVLGSAIEVTHTFRRVERVSGVLGGSFGTTPDGLGILVGYQAEPITETVYEYEINAVIVRYNNRGEPCVDVRPRCRSRARTFQRAFVTDGFRYTNNEGGFLRPSTEVIPINPRYEVLADVTDVSENCSAPIYPEVAYGPVDFAAAEVSACGVNWERLACYGNAGPGCPGPGNPWYYRRALQIDGVLGCNYGRQSYRYEVVTKIAPNDYPAGYANPHPIGEGVQTELVTQELEYRVNVLSSENCEARSCDDIGTGSGDTGGILPLLGGGIGPSMPEQASRGGCSSCRQGPGL